MATTNKILGHIKPIALTNTIVYTVPSSTQANINLFVANQSTSGADNVSLTITPSGSSLDTTQYIIYNSEIAQNGFLNITGIAINDGDKIYANSKYGVSSFVATGLEVT